MTYTDSRQGRVSGRGLALSWKVALALGVIFAALLLPALPAQAAQSYQYVTQWGTAGSGSGQFNWPVGVAVDTGGSLYVSDFYNNRIEKFDSNGNYITEWGSLGAGDGQFNQPRGIGVDSDGSVYVADTNNNRIQKFDSSGAYLTQWGTAGSGNGQLYWPAGVAVDSGGSIYVADQYNNRIQKFDSNGAYLTKWGSEGSGNGQFSNPLGLAVDSSGSVYVADMSNSRIQRFDSSGGYLTQWGTAGGAAGQFNTPFGVAVDSSGSVYVADRNNNRIQKFDSNGSYLTQWGISSGGNGQFNWPCGVAADPDGSIYVADTYNNRIQKFQLAARNYYWTWYDNIGGNNWVLLANPAESGILTYQLAIGGNSMNLANYNGGVIGPGKSITPIFPGVMGGPVKATGTPGAAAVLSQRILWPKGGSSMEEVTGTDESRLSNVMFWTWYDQESAGYTNWVLIANPGQDHNGNPQGAVSAVVKIGGNKVWSGSIDPGEKVSPTFPGVMGGPVEVDASGDVMASQRVLSNYGGAFNEVAGIPARELSDHYYWTWYDMRSAGSSDWVLIANPNELPVTAHIRIAGVLRGNYQIAPGQNVTPTFPGVMGGPVEVWADSGAEIIATQRSIFGPSFEEMPGLASSRSGGFSALSRNYSWTWYDQLSPGMTNWVLVANPDPVNSVKANIKIGSYSASYSIPPGQSITPTFPGKMAGPVTVSADGNVFASQRVLNNGYFNEVLGVR